MTAHTSNGMHGKLALEWKAWLAGIANKGADLLFPPHCVSCRRFGAWICSDCLDEIERIHPPICPRCGMPWDGASDISDNCMTDSTRRSGCRFCQHRTFEFDRLLALAFHSGPLRVAIHQLKYKDLRALAVPLGRLMSDGWATWVTAADDIDVIVPVSLHPKRQQERGYNQSALLARQLGLHLRLPVAENALVRTRATVPQVGLDADARRENVRNAFRCIGSMVDAKRVLLVDDVCTTGATLEAASVALRDGGARAVWAFALARARGPSDPDASNPIEESGKWI